MSAGLYQVGSFVGDAWQEWNGRFRDDMRRFVASYVVQPRSGVLLASGVEKAVDTGP